MQDVGHAFVSAGTSIITRRVTAPETPQVSNQPISEVDLQKMLRTSSTVQLLWSEWCRGLEGRRPARDIYEHFGQAYVKHDKSWFSPR